VRRARAARPRSRERVNAVRAGPGFAPREGEGRRATVRAPPARPARRSPLPGDAAAWRMQRTLLRAEIRLLGDRPARGQVSRRERPRQESAAEWVDGSERHPPGARRRPFMGVSPKHFGMLARPLALARPDKPFHPVSHSRFEKQGRSGGEAACRHSGKRSIRFRKPALRAILERSFAAGAESRVPWLEDEYTAWTMHTGGVGRGPRSVRPGERSRMVPQAPTGNRMERSDRPSRLPPTGERSRMVLKPRMGNGMERFDRSRKGDSPSERSKMFRETPKTIAAPARQSQPARLRTEARAGTRWAGEPVFPRPLGATSPSPSPPRPNER